MDNLQFFFTWMTTQNPSFGNAVPIEMMEAGRGKIIAAFIRDAIEDAKAAAEIGLADKAGGTNDGTRLVRGRAMSHEENAAKYLWQRDEARAKVQRLEHELEHARVLLKYADDAVRGEYERFVAYASSDIARRLRRT